MYVVVYPPDIIKYDSTGAGAHSLLAPSYTDPQGNLQDTNPLSVAVYWSNYVATVYVASGFAYPNKVVRFNSPDVGYPFSVPAVSLSVDGSGMVYAVDDHANLIRKLNSNGVVLDQWGGTGSGSGQFNTPRAIAVDRNGNAYVVDVLNNRIQKFSTVPSVLIN